MKLAFLTGVALVAGEKATPMGKIIGLLETMLADAKKDAQEENVLMRVVAEDCSNSIRELNENIGKEEDTIEAQNGIIMKSEAKIAECLQEIDVLNADTDGNKNDMSAATEVRELEKTDFTAASNDYSESLSALDRASQLLKSNSAEVHSPVFLQTVKDSKIGNADMKNELVSSLESAFMQASNVGTGTGVAYGSAMGGVIQMLDDLKQKFQNELRQTNADEQAAGHAYQALMNERSGENHNNKEQVNRKNLQKGDAGAAKEGAQSKKEQALASLSDFKDLLNKTTTECNADARHYAKQQAERADEIDALAQAIDMLKAKVMPNAQNIDPTAVNTPVALLQLSSSFDGAKQNQVQQEFLERGEHAIQMLLQAASNSKSGAKTLQALATRLQTVSSEVASGQISLAKKNPFKQVITMIRGIIKDINEQMVKDAATHGQCEADKAVAKLEKESLQKDLAEASAKEDQLQSQKEALTQEIADLTEELSNLAKSREAATKDRVANKAENERVMAECTEAIEALDQVFEILKTSQSKVSSAAAEAKPANADTYGGDQEGYAAVLQMLQVVQEDFVKEESEAETTEAEQADAYKQLMNSTEVTVARQQTVKKMREETLATTSRDLITKSDEVVNLTGRLDTAVKQEANIHRRCKGGVTHEERQAQIATEIQNLKEAKEVLEGFSATPAP